MIRVLSAAGVRPPFAPASIERGWIACAAQEMRRRLDPFQQKFDRSFRDRGGVAAECCRAIRLEMTAAERDFATRRPCPVGHPSVQLGLGIEPAAKARLRSAQHDGVRGDRMGLEPREHRGGIAGIILEIVCKMHFLCPVADRRDDKIGVFQRILVPRDPFLPSDRLALDVRSAKLALQAKRQRFRLEGADRFGAEDMARYILEHEDFRIENPDGTDPRRGKLLRDIGAERTRSDHDHAFGLEGPDIGIAIASEYPVWISAEDAEAPDRLRLVACGYESELKRRIPLIAELGNLDPDETVTVIVGEGENDGRLLFGQEPGKFVEVGTPLVEQQSRQVADVIGKFGNARRAREPHQIGGLSELGRLESAAAVFDIVFGATAIVEKPNPLAIVEPENPPRPARGIEEAPGDTLRPIARPVGDDLAARFVSTAIARERARNHCFGLCQKFAERIGRSIPCYDLPGRQAKQGCALDMRAPDFMGFGNTDARCAEGEIFAEENAQANYSAVEITGKFPPFDEGMTNVTIGFDNVVGYRRYGIYAERLRKELLYCAASALKSW